ncbi:ABC transporter permease [Candidatus Acetothermia bacterium]|nr:ABC transporter permease [Candidatus Acetothermia bacterium]MBI3460656.1 ABC transporter permease [Candidatus Acetothermia bacterium]MBI3660184.1 ABC transporter permease [Candidatus Acetothermia bacterium]
MLLDYMELALHNIRSRKLRSWLTILGIVIGVTAVVALIAIGQGMKQSVEKEFEAIGFDTILMFPGGLGGQGAGGGGQGGGGGGGGFFGGAQQPTKLNVSILGNFPKIIEKYGYTRVEAVEVSSPAMHGVLRSTGLSPEVTKDFRGYFRGFEMAEGREFQENDDFAVILGNQIATDLKANSGTEIEIDKKKFKVIGILTAIQTRGGFGAGGINNAIYIPIKTMEAMFTKKDKDATEGKEGTIVSTILIKAAKGTKVADVSQQVRQIMNRQGTPVNTVTAEEINNRINGVLGTVQTTLAAIAAISLLVGAIGVMNTMYTSVLERTREIGILKAVGAKDRHVLGVFLIESGLIGLIGGTLGILLGVAISSGAGGFMGRALAFGPIGGGSFSPDFSPVLIIGTLLFSFVLGAISGTLPARMAAQLRTVEALRYE